MTAFNAAGAPRLALAAMDAFEDLLGEDGMNLEEVRDFLGALAGIHRAPRAANNRLLGMAADAVRASLEEGRPSLAAWDDLAVAVASDSYPSCGVYPDLERPAFYFNAAAEVADRLSEAADFAGAGEASALAARLSVAAAMVRHPGDHSDLSVDDLMRTRHVAFVPALLEVFADEGRFAEAVEMLVAGLQAFPGDGRLVAGGATLMRSILSAAIDRNEGVSGMPQALAEHADVLRGAGDALWEQMEWGERPEGARPDLAPLYAAYAGAAEGTAHHVEFAFQAGYRYHGSAPGLAAGWYRKVLVEDPENAAALNNLLMLTEGDLDAAEAVDLARRLYRLRPDAGVKARLARLETRADFQKTALARWPALDRYKRRILASLTLIDRFSFAELSRYTGIEQGPLRGHWSRLVDQGMVLESADGANYLVNPVIRHLVERENTHALAIRVVRGGEDVRVKPVFNSNREFQVYKILLQVFPNMLVFPNISLQAIMPYEAMKAALSREEFGYYLYTSADYGIVSTTSYLPIACIELDSPWHDTDRQAAKDGRKDRIFAASGIPLVRVRVHGDMSDAALRHEVAAAMGGIGADLRHVADRSPFAAKMVEEVERARVQGEWGGQN